MNFNEFYSSSSGAQARTRILRIYCMHICMSVWAGTCLLAAQAAHNKAHIYNYKMYVYM